MAKITEAQIKELQKKFTKKQLEEIAEKFGKIPNSFTKSADIIAAGYLTQEEFDALPICPRTGEVTSVASWPKIGGRKTYPLSGALTYDETVKYYEFYKAAKKGTSSVSGGSTKKLSEEQQKNVDYIRQYLKEVNAPADVVAKFEDLLPKKKDNLLNAMFGVDSVQQLPGKVNVAYVMFRGPSGEFADELQPNGGDLFTKGFMPKFTLDQIKANLAKLKERGVDIDACIVDLQ